MKTPAHVKVTYHFLSKWEWRGDGVQDDNICYDDNPYDGVYNVTYDVIYIVCFITDLLTLI